MILSFELSMPGRSSWDGRWSGENRLHCIVKSFRGEKQVKEAFRILSSEPYRYLWDDGWSARIGVREVDSKEANKLRRKSDGFCGYDWMVDTIIKYGKPLATHQIPKAPDESKQAIHR